MLLVEEDQQVHKVLKVLQDLVVELDLQDLLVQQDLQDLQDLQELYLLLEQECYSNKHQHQVDGQK